MTQRSQQNSIFNMIDDVAYNKIASKASRKFHKLLSRDDIEQCQRIGIWNGLRKYNGKSSSLLTFIYNNVVWECLNTIELYRPIRLGIVRNKTYFNIDKLKTYMDSSDFDIIHKKYIDNYTLKEIAQSQNISISKVNRKIKKALLIAKEILS